MASFRHSSLKTRFNLAMAVVFLLIAAASVLFFERITKEILTEFAKRTVIKEALLERTRIRSAIDREVALSLSLASDPVMLRWAENEDDAASRQAALAQLRHYRRLFRDTASFFAVVGSRHYYIILSDKEGEQPRFRTMDRSNPLDKWFFQAVETVDNFALNLDYDALTRDTRVWINAVGYSPDGRKVGLGGTGLDITAFVHGIVGDTESGISSTLVDKNGIIMAHRDQSLMEHNGKAEEARKITIYTQMRQRADIAQLQQALRELNQGVGDEVRAFPVRTEQGQALMAVSALPGLGWYDIVIVNIDGIMGAKTFWPMIILLVAALSLVIVSVTVLIGRMVLRPLLRLNTAAQSMAAGHYGQSLDIRRNDEIGQLTQSFNAMSAQVHDTTANLESKVAERTRELENTNKALSDSRARIMESITYASQIQQAILPKDELLNKLFADYSVLYSPRDIVGGDLYYLREFDDHVLFAVLDCTGHGVPGALMTMTVHSVLNHVLSLGVHNDPTAVLRETDRQMREAFKLHETGAGSLDCGLDMAVCVWHPATGALHFAGAGLSLFVLEPGSLREIKGDRKRLGYRGAYEAYSFTPHEIAAGEGQRFYLVTDGFLDEGGGAKGFGFGQPRFEEMLKAHAQSPMNQQAALFADILGQYRGTRPQRDDITLFGFSLPRSTPAP